MNEQLSIRPGQAPGSSWGRKLSSRFSMPPELVARARRRLGILALVIGCLCVVFGPIAYFAPPLEGDVGDRSSWALRTSAIALLSFALYFATRSRRVGDGPVLVLGLVYEILLCLSDNTYDTWEVYRRLGEAPAMNSASLFIVMFPLLVPCRPTTTLIASLIAASTAPLGLYLGYWTGAIPQPDVADLIQVSISPFGCVVLAYMGSRVIHDMGTSLAQALDLGSYTLEELLGRGGMGEVWRASHRMLARPAAIKLIRPESLADDHGQAPALLARFEHEAQATASLRSPHTVELYDFGRTDGGTFYYVMELLDGLDLATLVERYGPQEPARVIHILVQACQSLEEAHRAGLIHRDIKPANLFLCRYGTEDDFVKVLDFGLVKQVSPEPTGAPALSQHGMVVGTPGFMAPEMVMGRPDVDGRADLYCLGCVAFWLLTGSMVFQGDTQLSVMLQHASAAPPSPSASSEFAVPEALDRIIVACLAKDPNQRPASAADLARQLRACPVDRPWTDDRARTWWDAHRP